MSEPTPARQRFADRLREVREAVGVSGARLAQLAGWHPAKVTRIQRGQQSPTEQDIRVWAEHTDPSLTADLLAQFADVRADEARWSRQLRSGHHAVQEAKAGLEARATRIRSFDTALVTGLLQTADYARIVFQLHAAQHRTMTDIDAAVASRMQRQHVLYDSTKDIDLLMTEAALRNPLGGHEVMAAQIDRIRAVAGSVKVGVIPLDTPFFAMHGLWMYDDLVEVEIAHTTIATTDSHDAEMYSDLLDTLWKSAVTGTNLRRLLDGLA